MASLLMIILLLAIAPPVRSFIHVGSSSDFVCIGSRSSLNLMTSGRSSLNLMTTPTTQRPSPDSLSEFEEPMPCPPRFGPATLRTIARFTPFVVGGGYALNPESFDAAVASAFDAYINCPLSQNYMTEAFVASGAFVFWIAFFSFYSFFLFYV